MGSAAYMRRALELARQGLGRTSPNPAVGAVVVRDQAIIAEAYHQCAGEPHAERLALQAAGERAHGADLYCTLEPCCHYGRTPPCTNIIIESGIRRVWYASDDPDPRCDGGGAAALKAAGVEVHAGLLQAEADRLNEAYFHHKRTGRPFVTLKLACSLDGQVATRTGHARWITGDMARQHVHELRNRSDAVLVGVGTILADNPHLNVRLDRVETRDPWRVVVDTHARTPITAAILASGPACLLAVSEKAAVSRITALQRAGAEVLRLPEAGGHVDLAALLAELGQREIMSVLCEGGPTLAAGLVIAGLVNKYLWFYAPKLIGGDGLAAMGMLGLDEVEQAPRLCLEKVEMLDRDLLVTAYPCLPD